MDRIIVYPGAIPLDTDLLATNRNTLAALHGVLAATLGGAAAVDGLAVAATAPPSMSVVVGPGSITATGPLDAAAYGSLPADTADSIVRMGLLLQAQTLTLAAPATPGTAVVWLVQAGFAETDLNPVVLPYYNAANPAMPYLGPGNSGAAQPTLRAQRAQIALKAGAPAPLGTPVAPSPDAGWVALASVTLAYGATQVNPADIAANPVLRQPAWKLPELRPGYAFAAAYSNSGSFVVPAGVTRLKVTVIGGGGAGGTHATQAAGGGGAGARGEAWLSGLVPGSAIAVTVGAPGFPVPASAPANGGPGGTSSFGTFVSATGGGGGGGGWGAPAGGGGGAAPGANVYFYGGMGGDGVSGRGGDGAGPSNGKGGSAGANGMNAPGFGGGGGGGGSGAAGGAGGGGLVIVEY